MKGIAKDLAAHAIAALLRVDDRRRRYDLGLKCGGDREDLHYGADLVGIRECSIACTVLASGTGIVWIELGIAGNGQDVASAHVHDDSHGAFGVIDMYGVADRALGGKLNRAIKGQSDRSAGTWHRAGIVDHHLP